MNSFTYYAPTKIIFGRGTEKETAAEIMKHGGKNVLLVYGGKSARKSGLLDTIEHELAEASLPYKELGGVKPNPRLELAEQGVKIAQEMKADFILAVGGGSVIDTAKAISLGVANPETPLWDFWLKKAQPVRNLPVGVVLTISASGSEMSDSSVLTKEATHEKRGINTNLNRPCFAILDPELTFTLPKYQVACGVVDIMMHTLDRYFTSPEEYGNQLTDEIAEALLRVVIRNGRQAVADPHGYGPMSELMWAGSLSHNDLTGLGAVKDFSTHQLGHELSAMFDVAHGASLSTMWGPWARYCCGQDPARFAQYAEKVWGVSGKGTAEAAKLGIDKTIDYFHSLDMPTCFTELKIGVQSDETIHELADRCVFRGARKVGHFKELGREDCYQIYKAANR